MALEGVSGGRANAEKPEDQIEAAMFSSDGLFFGGALQLALPFTTGVIFDRNGTVPVVKLSGRSRV